MRKDQDSRAFGGRKADGALDLILVIIVLFIMGIVAVTGYKVFDDINQDIQSDTTLSNSTKETSQALYARYPQTMDGAFMLAFVLLWGVVLVGAFMLDSHPIFFVFTLILLIFIVYIGAEISNFYAEYTGDAELATYAASFPMTNHVIGNIATYIILIAASIGIVTYGKYRMGY